MTDRDQPLSKEEIDDLAHVTLRLYYVIEGLCAAYGEGDKKLRRTLGGPIAALRRLRKETQAETKMLEGLMHPVEEDKELNE